MAALKKVIIGIRIINKEARSSFLILNLIILNNDTIKIINKNKKSLLLQYILLISIKRIINFFLGLE